MKCSQKCETLNGIQHTGQEPTKHCSKISLPPPEWFHFHSAVLDSGPPQPSVWAQMRSLRKQVDTCWTIQTLCYCLISEHLMDKKLLPQTFPGLPTETLECISGVLGNGVSVSGISNSPLSAEMKLECLPGLHFLFILLLFPRTSPTHFSFILVLSSSRSLCQSSWYCAYW